MDEPAEENQRWSRLMAAAQDGDRVAYERLLREIVPFVRAVVQCRHRAAERIEDVVQDVLLTVHRVRHTYDPARPFRSWLAQIARRRSIDALRRRLHTEIHEIAGDTAYETLADPRANRALEVAAAHEAVRKAVAGLSGAQREAIELLRLRELSPTEASSLTGKSIAALRVNMHRAIKSLGRRLKGDGNDR